MKRILLLHIGLVTLILGVGVLFASPQPTSAADIIRDGINVTAQEGQLPRPSDVNADPNTALQERLGLFINSLFGILGAIFLTVVLVGGYVWLTAGGNEENVAKGKGWIVNGINGVLVIFLSYALVFVILTAIGSATN